jgi:hypothetical protein
MDDKGLLGAIAHVNSIWSIAAFAIAAIVAILKLALASPNAARKRGKAAPPALGHSIVWPSVIVICLIGALPILANTYLESQRIQQQSLFRIRVTVLDPQGNPSRASRSARRPRTRRRHRRRRRRRHDSGWGDAGRSQGHIFADLESAFLHGRANLQLADDPNLR